MPLKVSCINLHYKEALLQKQQNNQLLKNEYSVSSPAEKRINGK